MKATGKPVPVVLGWCFIAYAGIAALFVLPGANDSHSPILYVAIFGGLFVAIPAVLGIAIVREHRQRRMGDPGQH